MPAPDPAPARGSVRLFFSLAALALAFSILIEVIGGINTRVSGVRISAHGFLRPLLFALACFMAGFWRLDAQGRDRLTQRLSTLWLGALPWLVPIAAAIVLGLGLAFGTRAAGGSDPYGYVSQSELWRAGDLRVHQELAGTVPWPNAEWTFTPLGYRPAASHTLVPTYAPGLPLLMAIFAMVFGSCGPFFVGPACGAVLVLLTYGLGVKLSDKVVGAIAALCIAASPTVLFMSLWPMSDVPCATFWAASLLLATRRTGWASAASGIAAGIAIAIRPNLVPLALGPLAIALWRSAPAEPRVAGNRVRQLLAFAAGCAPFVLFIGWLFNELYGSPLQSGYGDSGSIFAWSNLKPNLLRYPAWLWDTQSPLAFLFLLAPVLRAGNLSLRRLYFAFITAVVAAYLWYLPFEVWWFLRFLLPALPLVFVLAAEVASSLAARVGERARVLATVVFAVVVVGYSATRARDLHVLDIGRGEQKYADVGRYLAAHLPDNAVVICMQHSGSVRFYAHRPTLRFDVLDADWLDRARAHLRASGYEPYLLLEDFEVAAFRARFAGQESLAFLDNTPMAVTTGRQVQLYRMDVVFTRGGDPSTARMPRTSGCTTREK